MDFLKAKNINYKSLITFRRPYLDEYKNIFNGNRTITFSIMKQIL